MMGLTRCYKMGVFYTFVFINSSKMTYYVSSGMMDVELSKLVDI